MLNLRLLRTGKKNQPSYKIVVVDKRKAADHGRFIEEVGFLNPITKEKNLKADRIKYWLSVGVKPSPTMHNLLVQEKIIDGKKIALQKKSKKLEEKKEEAKKEAPATIVSEVKPETPKTPETEVQPETQPAEPLQ